MSIGRRLTDLLVELVRIDPKSIGVGQYQHDVDQTTLKSCLDDVVVGCVNRVGVQDGLLHISQLAERYVKDPNEIVKVAQEVQVRVLSVDLERRRIALSMRSEKDASTA